MLVICSKNALVENVVCLASLFFFLIFDIFLFWHGVFYFVWIYFCEWGTMDTWEKDVHVQQLWRQIFIDCGVDITQTYWDRLRLRIQPPHQTSNPPKKKKVIWRHLFQIRVYRLLFYFFFQYFFFFTHLGKPFHANQSIPFRQPTFRFFFWTCIRNDILGKTPCPN